MLDTAIRYAPRFLPSPIAAYFTMGSTRPPCKPTNHSGVEDILSLLETARAQGKKTCVVQHATMTEADRPKSKDAERLRELFKVENVLTVALLDFIRSETTTINHAYRDDIHLNNTGQIALGKALAACNKKMDTVR